MLTDNGPQYHTWRGKSAFTKLLERRGVRQIVARPRRPQTLGKVERFWQTLWRECVEAAIFRGLDDARRRIGHFIGYYNFQRTHSSLGGLVPADRFFDAAKDVRAALEVQVAKNALELAREGEPRKPFYLTGRVGNETISLHAEGERVVPVREDGSREEVDLGAGGLRIDVHAKAREAALGDEALDERPAEWSPENDATGGGFYAESFAGPARHEDEDQGEDGEGDEDHQDLQHEDPREDHLEDGGDDALEAHEDEAAFGDGPRRPDEQGSHGVPAPGTSPLGAALADLVRNWPESEPFGRAASEHTKDDELGDAFGDEARGDAAGNPRGGRP